MATYRRIEIKAYRRRLTTVVGERPRQTDAPLGHALNGVSLDGTYNTERVALDSAEVQAILREALGDLDYRLSPQTQGTICADQEGHSTNSGRNRFYPKLRTIYRFICPKTLRFDRKEK